MLLVREAGLAIERSSIFYHFSLFVIEILAFYQL